MRVRLKSDLSLSQRLKFVSAKIGLKLLSETVLNQNLSQDYFENLSLKKKFKLKFLTETGSW